MKKPAALLLAACVLGVLVWVIWSGVSQGKREQRDLALVSAVQKDDLPAATRLLNEGASPDAQTPPTSLGQKIRHYQRAVSGGAGARALGRLRDRGPHYSVLEIAAMRGDAAMVGLLLSRGADASYHDRTDRTAHDWALGAGSPLGGGPRGGRDYGRVLTLLEAARRPKGAVQPAPILPSHRPMAKTMPPPMMTWTTVCASGLFMKR